MKKANSCINCLKGIACILVVFLHVGFPGFFGECMYAVAAIGVPIFFMVSGFFTSADDMDKLKSVTLRRSAHIARMLGITALIYFANSMFICWLDGGAYAMAVWFKAFDLKNIIKLIALNMTSFIDGWGIMWFMLALIYCYFAFYVLRVIFKKTELYYLLIPVLLGFHLIVRYFFNLKGISYGSVYFQNWLFDGLPFFLMGNYIAKHNYNRPFLQKITAKILAIAAVSGLALSIVEACLVGHTSFYFGTVLAVAAFMLIAARYPEWGKDTFIACIGGKYSMVVYLSHTLIYLWIVRLWKFDRNGIFGWLMPFVVLMLSITVAAAFDRLTAKKYSLHYLTDLKRR